MTEAPKILLVHHLKTLKLPTFLREYEKLARQCAAEGLDHVQFLARLVELELIDRERRMVERRIKAAKFPATKSLDSFDFKAIPKLNKMQVLELARCEWPYGDASIPYRLTDRSAGARHRPRAEWNRQDPYRPRPGSGRLPEGNVGQLHHRRRVRLRIGRVVLLALHERLDVGRRDQPHLMAQLADLAPPEVRTAAGFHRYDTRSQLPEESQHLIPSQLLAQHGMPGDISSMHLKHILRQIEPDRGNLLHDRSSLWILADPPWYIDAVGGR